MNKSMVELAAIIRKSAQGIPKYEGFLIGKVLAPPPEIRIEIDEGILLDRTHLIFSASVLNGYQREFEIEGDIQFTDENSGTTTVSSGHSHGIQSLNINSQSLKAKGKLKWTDTLKKDELVILVPAGNQQMYIVIEKAVEL